MFSAAYLYLKKHRCYGVSFPETHIRVADQPPPNNFWSNFWIFINCRMNVIPLFLLCRPEQVVLGDVSSYSCSRCTRFESRPECKLSWSRFCGSALPASSGILLWSTACCTMDTRSFPGVKWADRGMDSLPPSVEGLRMCRSYTSTFFHCLPRRVMVWPLLWNRPRPLHAMSLPIHYPLNIQPFDAA